MKMTGAQSLCGVFLLASASAGFAQEVGGADVVREYYETLQQIAPELLTKKTKHQLRLEIQRLEFKARNQHSNPAAKKHAAADTDEEEDVEYYLDE